MINKSCQVVPKDGGAITFKIWSNKGIMLETWQEKRERQHRAARQEAEAVTPSHQPVMMEVAYGVTGADRKTLVAVVATATGEKADYLGMPSQVFKIGEYVVDKDGTLRGPESADLIAALAARGERWKRCPCGAFAEGKSDLSESTETSDATAPREQHDD